MRILFVSMMFAVLWVALKSPAAEPGTREVLQEIGAALAWRLGPETIEEACRSIDPDNTDARKKALEAWRVKNGALIREVDSRVEEVVPVLNPKAPAADSVKALRSSVKALLLETHFGELGDEQKVQLCKSVSNPADERWNDNGMPHVQQALAVLYDWKMQQGAK